MCPGTLFMVKFVNWLEQEYPFADHLKPVTALSRIREPPRPGGSRLDTHGFAARHPTKVPE